MWECILRLSPLEIHEKSKDRNKWAHNKNSPIVKWNIFQAIRLEVNGK